MITAERVHEMINLSTAALTAGIRASGAKSDEFVYSSFTGISNAGEFVYNVGLRVAEAVRNRKVVVAWCPARQSITVRY